MGVGKLGRSRESGHCEWSMLQCVGEAELDIWLSGLAVWVAFGERGGTESAADGAVGVDGRCFGCWGGFCEGVVMGFDCFLCICI